MLGTLIDTHRQYARTDLSKEMETLRTTKRNAADQKHCNRNEKCLLWANQQTGLPEERIFELKYIQQKLPKFKKKDKKD